MPQGQRHPRRSQRSRRTTDIAEKRHITDPLFRGTSQRLSDGRQLPTPAGRLIGREQELWEIQQLLSLPEICLLTLTGPPGVGKTRLAIEVSRAMASSFTHGVCFVDLSLITDSALVPSIIASAAGIRETGQPVLAQLTHVLRKRHMLVLTDNLEHLPLVREQIVEIASKCPAVKFLVTSRAPLHLHAERLFVVRPLEVPDLSARQSTERFTSISSVALFLDRAQAGGDFTISPVDVPAIAGICRRLDGLPLAIELAAARMRTLTPRALEELLAQSHEPTADLLTSQCPDLAPRHRTLHAAIAWSYRLLSQPLQKLLRRLSVFPGGCTVDAMEHVCMEWDLPVSASDGFESLVEHSLLEREGQPDGLPRYRLLSTIREFALGEAARREELSTLRQRHACFFASLAEQAAPHLWGADQIIWLNRLETEIANLRSALDWSMSPAGDQDVALRLGGSLHRFWGLRGHWDEGTRVFDRLLATLPQRSPHRVRMLISRGYHAVMRADYTLGFRMMTEAWTLSKAIEDAWGIAFGLLGQGVIEWTQGRKDEGLSLISDGVEQARQSNSTVPLAYGLLYKGLIALIDREHVRAATLAQEALRHGRAHGNREFLQLAYIVLGLSDMLRGHHEESVRSFREGLRLACELDEQTVIATGLEGIGWTGVAVGDAAWGVRLLGAAEALRQKTGGIGTPILTWYLHHQRYVKIAKHLLGENRFTAAWTAGLAMSPEDAIAEATNMSKPSAVESGRLSRRETEVAQLIAEGLTNRQIAAVLLVGERTAECHVQHILNKLGFRSRAQIAAWAVAASLRNQNPPAHSSA